MNTHFEVIMLGGEVLRTMMPIRSINMGSDNSMWVTLYAEQNQSDLVLGVVRKEDIAMILLYPDSEPCAKSVSDMAKEIVEEAT